MRLQLTTVTIKTQNPTSDLEATKVFIFKDYIDYLSKIMIQNTEIISN